MTGRRPVRARAAWDESDLLRRRVATPAQTLALITGTVFVGLAVTGLSTPAGTAQHAGLIQLLFAGAGIVTAGTPQSAIRFLIRGGALYLGLALVGLGLESTASFAPVNSADFFHYVLGGTMIIAGARCRFVRKSPGRTARILGA